MASHARPWPVLASLAGFGQFGRCWLVWLGWLDWLAWLVWPGRTGLAGLAGGTWGQKPFVEGILQELGRNLVGMSNFWDAMAEG